VPPRGRSSFRSGCSSFRRHQPLSRYMQGRARGLRALAFLLLFAVIFTSTPSVSSRCPDRAPPRPRTGPPARAPHRRSPLISSHYSAPKLPLTSGRTPVPELPRAPRSGFERLAAAIRRVSVSPSPRRGNTGGGSTSTSSATSATSSINSTSSVGSVQEDGLLLPAPEHRELCPRPRDGPRASVRLRHRHSLHSLHFDLPRHADALPLPSSEHSPGSSGCSTPFLSNVCRDKLSPTQRQMYERLRLVNEQLMHQHGAPPSPTDSRHNNNHCAA
jgi:hypothetical protein